MGSSSNYPRSTGCVVRSLLFSSSLFGGHFFQSQAWGGAAVVRAPVQTSQFCGDRVSKTFCTSRVDTFCADSKPGLVRHETLKTWWLQWLQCPKTEPQVQNLSKKTLAGHMPACANAYPRLKRSF